MYSIGWSLIKIWAGLEDSERIPRILKEFLEGSESIMRGFSFIQEMCDYMSKILQDIWPLLCLFCTMHIPIAAAGCFWRIPYFLI